MNTKPSRESNGGRVVILTILGLLVLFGGGYVAAYAGAGAKVPRGASVAGIDIGGKSHGDAVSTLEEGMADRAEIDVTVDGKKTSVPVADTGIEVDAEASVTEAGGGRSWSPTRLWHYYTGGEDIDPVVNTDEAALTATVDKLTKEFGTPTKDGAVTFKGGRVHRVASAKGTAIDPDQAREELTNALLTGDAAELDLVEADPDINDDDVQNALNDFGNAAVSGPVTLVFDKAKVRLSPAQFAPVLSMKAENGRLVPDLDEKRLTKLVRSQFSDPKGAPVDATVKLVNGKPKVIPAKPGVDYEPSDISSAFLDLVAKESGREVKVKATVKQPDFTTADAKKLGIKTQISTFTTHFPYAEYRNVNLGRAAELISGTILKPGETFSLNDTVGERTAENGFTKGFIISNGIFKEDFGGGVSQMATTLFNAMFFAGLEDVEHKPHSFYIDRYPVGREATVVWGSLDLKFKNDTDHGVLINAHLAPSSPSGQGSLTVSMYSTKVWDITTKTGERYNFTSPQTRTMTTADCYPNSGYGGFDINVWRYFAKAGSGNVERTEKFHTTYTPSDSVVCKEPEAPKKPDEKPSDDN
ncbi:MULTISPECIES: VanW family protein [unclassified Nocardioides]|uniref:VanW family protein n=1 Tax=unclassified Nocardioides TaxID=2615069 RepID=UPI000AE9278A|nr:MULTISPECIES: VanW family protein [unclassified Nocardioides]